MQEDGSRAVVIAAFFANLGIAIAKFVGFLLTGAASMLAEAVHSAADTGNQGLLLLGGKRARQTESSTHPFGYGRERYFWAFVVAMVLFSLGGLFAIYEGIDKIRHPHELESVFVAVGILLVAVVFETYALTKAIKVASKERAGRSWWTFLRRSKNPEIPVVLLEDAGAELGLIVALFGIAMARLTGDPRWDAAGSLGIGVLLVAIAVFLAIEMKSLLIGESAGPDDQAAIRSAIESAPDVRRLIHLRTQHLGPDELLVGAKVELDAALTFPEVAATIDRTEQQLRAAVPEARVVYLEPDIAHP
ncbi:MAG TPA: cation diffusion facilitator family transporter [Acidimicrobiales bacterium]|nr:cation diffusion facilitator family transporter [Acidimicrobiales bacterium]